jgi:P27 family predicted phage terminase small subunit
MEPPYALSPDAREVWDFTLAQLRGMRLAHASDRDALVCYCEAVVTHRKATAGLAAGLLLRTSNGRAYMRNPLIATQRDSAALVRILAREFGLTPSARSDIHVGGKHDDRDGAERLLS